MPVIGVICEYNPFHNGHAWHLRRSRELLHEDSTVICVMSGDFVQRGEAAAFSKFARAEAACRCGADLVIELPLPWAISSAESFAQGGVSLLDGLGAEYLSFGSEQGELAPLETIAEAICAPQTQEEIRQLLAQQPQLSYPAARQAVLTQRLGDGADALSQPNNILGVEYIRAIWEFRLQIQPMTVARQGSGHDTRGTMPGMRSASEIRSMLQRGESIDGEVPLEAAEIYVREEKAGRIPCLERVETALLSRLRMFDEAYYRDLPDASDGVGERLYKAVRQGEDLETVLQKAKTKRYAMARLRRMTLCAALGVKAGEADKRPPYARVLAMNDRGRGYLASLRKRDGLPLLIKPSTVSKLSADCRTLFAIEAAAHDLYTLCYSARESRLMGEDWRNGPVLVESG